jgi:PAS domain S-box-containing protein
MFIIALITWITAWSRERLEKVLRTRERSHKMLFDSSSNPIIIRKPDGTVIDANDAASIFLGYAYEEITKMNAKSWYLSEDEWKKVSKEIAYQTVNQSTYEVLTTYVPKNGEKIRVNLTGNVLKRNGESLYQTIIKPLDSREMEQELHQSQIKYRTLIDSVDGIVWESDIDSHFTFVSAQAVKLLGYPTRDWINNPEFLIEHIHENDRNRFVDNYKEMTRVKKDHELEYRMIDIKGNTIWVRDIISVVVKVDEVIGFRGILVDISARKEAEMLKSEAQSMLQLQMDKMPVACILWNPVHTINSWNPAAEKMFGYSQAEAIGATVEQLCLVSQEEVKKVDAVWDQLNAGRVVNSENLNLTKDGRQILCNWINTPLIKDGVSVGILSMAEDITEHRQAEKRITDLARFPEENPNPVARILPDGTFLYLNDAAKDVMSDELKKSGKILEKYLERIQQIWETGMPVETEIMVSKNRSLNLYIVPVRFSGYINLYGRDVTNEKILSEKLNQALKMEAIGRLAGGIAHDFNNLLTVIGGYTDIALEKANSGIIESEEIKFDIEQIKLATKRAATVTSQLLAFSRKSILQMRVMDLNASVTTSQKMLSNFIGENIEIKSFLNEDLGRIKADPTQIEQIIMNMCINSKDAMPRGGTITIETNNKTIDEEYVKTHPEIVPGNFVCMAISDTGHGMGKDVLAKIFEPFFTTKPKGKGTGLGLSMVYGIVKQCSGSIYCYSELDKGTTFKIYLPRVDEEVFKEEQLIQSFKMIGTETVLLVEDDMTVRNLTKMFLTRAGYHIMEATNGTDAIEVAKSNADIHLLVTDVIMPHMNGKELALIIQKIHPNIKILFISGYTDNTIVHQGILEEGVNFLQKPFSNKEFLEKVRRVLDNGDKSE